MSADGCAHCGHTFDAHFHYRAGTDCSACDCLAFLGPLALWWRKLRKIPLDRAV